MTKTRSTRCPFNAVVVRKSVPAPELEEAGLTSRRPAEAEMAAALRRALHTPGAASPATLLEMNHRYGNRTIQRLLQQQKAVPLPGTEVHAHPAPIQRFPASVFDAPYKGWKKNKFEIVRPGEGKSGGVFIAKDTRKGQPVTTVVIKPLMEGFQGAAASQWGDTILQEFGINTPNSRIVQKDSSEFKKINGMVGELMDPEQKGKYQAYKLMAALTGGSLSSRMDEASGNTQKTQEVLELLTDRRVLDQIGRMMVVDPMMGNSDRIGITVQGHKLNLGNIMFDGNRAVAIDSAAFLKNRPAIEGMVEVLNKESMMRGLIQDLIEVVELKLQGPLTDQVKITIQTGILVGMSNARSLLREIINRQRIEQSSQQHYGEENVTFLSMNKFKQNLEFLSWKKSEQQGGNRNNQFLMGGNRRENNQNTTPTREQPGQQPHENPPQEQQEKTNQPQLTYYDLLLQLGVKV